MRVVVGGKTHVWDLTLAWHNHGGSRTMPGKETTDKRGVVHPIRSEIALYHSTEELPKTSPAMQIKTDLERGIYMAAEDLFHELMHVLLLIGMDIEKANESAAAESDMAGTPRLYKEYQSTLETVMGPSFAAAREKVTASLVLLLQRTNTMKSLGHTDAAIESFAKSTFERMVNEKFVFGKTGERFGYTPPNERIAKGYISNYVLELFGEMGQILSGSIIEKLEENRGWKMLRGDAITRLKEFFDEMDKDLSLKGYLMPGMMGPPMLMGPAMPLTTSGAPITPWQSVGLDEALKKRIETE
jgi:hypothetical protein